MRFLAAALLTLTLATPTLADKKAEVCEGFAVLTEKAVELRKAGGMGKRKATIELNKDAGELEAMSKEIVNWIWSLPKNQLNDDIAQAVRDQCN